MVLEVGEYFKKELNRKLENCATQVRCGSKARDRNMNSHLRWSEPAEPFGLLHVSRESPPLTCVSVASLSRMVRERLGSRSVNGKRLARVKIGRKFRLKMVCTVLDLLVGARFEAVPHMLIHTVTHIESPSIIAIYSYSTVSRAFGSRTAWSEDLAQPGTWGRTDQIPLEMQLKRRTCGIGLCILAYRDDSGNTSNSSSSTTSRV